ncbi:hybrid sensor histidine kinase/response regulator [Herpetosiphon geysericola]|uniref:histidine kinase n=1 Tax=Herpetosiphon geysericola TaxID=70996 RepID=A0A0P6YK34_9CHLR|nr:PAS domain-containing sensor histidine kinase [Herpetosiphon geysericola]KPL90109.1 hypothetical protein SE18_07795 [Herpetosiphon geysericola]
MPNSLRTAEPRVDQATITNLLQSFDWRSTPLGAMETWPTTMRSIVDMMLAVPVAIATLWGRQGLLIYNASYSTIAGSRHPELFGRPILEAWPEIADFNQAILDQVFTGQSLTYEKHALMLQRNGRTEQAWFDLSYSPIVDQQGEILGVMALVVEITSQVLAEQQRYRAEERYQLALDAGLLIGTWDWDIVADRCIVDPRFAEYFSLDPVLASQGVSVSTMFESIHPDDRPSIAHLIESAIHNGQSYQAEYRVRHRDGGYRWVEASGFCIFENNQPQRFPGVLIDITERKRREDALAHSEARLRAIFDTLPVGLVFAETPTGRITDGNAHVERILLHPVLPSPATDAYGEWIAYDENNQLVPIHEYPLAIAVQTGQVSERDFHYQRGDGSRAWIKVIGGPVRDLDNTITGGLITIIDIDREKRTEKQLQALNNDLEGLVAQRTRERDRIWLVSQDLLGIADPDGNWLSINPAWQRTLGWDDADILGRTSTWLEHPDDQERTQQEITKLARGIPTSSFENRFRDRDGKYHWLSWTAVLDNKYLYCVARDITSEKQRQAEIEVMQTQLRQSQKMEAIGQLTGGIAHDFNNILTSILGGLDLLQRRINAGRFDTIERYINSAVKSAKRAAALTQRLLAFSRQQALDVQPINVNSLIQSLDDLLQRSLGEQIQVETTLGSDVWRVQTDANQLENALLNLAINARDAMPYGGTLRIATSNLNAQQAIQQQLDPADYVLIEVADTGTGMSSEIVERAFDPFFTTKPLGQGTGLGLSMIYGFIKQIGGHIHIDSQLEQGTTIKLYLPRDESGIDPNFAAESAQSRSIEGATILVVEDDEAVRMVLIDVLGELGYHTLESYDATSALAIFAQNIPIDLMITDIGLPKTDGYDLSLQIRQRYPNLPILLVSGYTDRAAVRSGQLEQYMELLSKPFEITDLANKIHDLLQQSH